MLESLFRLKENKTSVKTEVLAGFTTFMTMAYIIFVNPAILSDAGMPFNGVFIATIAGIILGTLAMAFLTNYPFALASGMGLNAFFAYSVVIGMGVSWQIALGIVFVEGIIFIILSVLPVRKMIVNSIPMGLKTAIGAGIGLFIAFIGLQNAGIIVDNPATLVGLGNILSGPALVALVGLILTGILHALKVKGSLLWGIILATIFGWLVPAAEGTVTPAFNGLVAMPSMGDWSSVLFKLDIGGALSIGLFGVILSFLFVDMFDTAGTLVGVSQQAGYLDKEGNLPKASNALLADAIGTTGGALFGTSTVTTYVESASGVAAMEMAGVKADQIDLIIVGTMMLANITRINWKDFTEVLPAFMTIVVMPLSYSIAHGIAIGFIVYPLIKLFTGRGKEVHWLVYTLGVIFLAYFIWL